MCGETMVVAAGELLESYAVLTRLPPPHRIDPRMLWRSSNFMNGVETVALGPDDYHACCANGIAGGRSYDVVIPACASQAGCRGRCRPSHFSKLPG